MGDKANTGDFNTWLKQEKQAVDDCAIAADAQVGEPADISELVESQAAQAREFLRRTKDGMSSAKQERRQAKEQLEREKCEQEQAAEQAHQEKLERQMREKIAEVNRRHGIVEEKRTWRSDAMEHMTDREYADWYDNYYFDPDKPF